MTHILVACALLLVVAPSNVGQRPDFSGEWTINMQRSRLQLQQLSQLEQATVRIEHREPAFTLHRRFIVGGRESTLSLNLRADGKEVVSQEGDQTHFSTLAWDGDVLVFVTRIVAPQGEATNTVRYHLLDGGRTLEADERFRGPRLTYDNVWVFDKKASQSKERAVTSRGERHFVHLPRVGARPYDGFLAVVPIQARNREVAEQLVSTVSRAPRHACQALGDPPADAAPPRETGRATRDSPVSICSRTWRRLSSTAIGGSRRSRACRGCRRAARGFAKCAVVAPYVISTAEIDAFLEKFEEVLADLDATRRTAHTQRAS